MDYDEDRELTRYVWGHFDHFMTEFERRVGRAIMAGQKATMRGSPESAAGLARAFRADGPDVDAALADGPDAYRRQMRDRLTSEHPTEVVVNRCPACRRVMRTPRARQCFWCGHDWHGPDV